jgi:hypothetical protein
MIRRVSTRCPQFAREIPGSRQRPFRPPMDARAEYTTDPIAKEPLVGFRATDRLSGRTRSWNHLSTASRLADDSTDTRLAAGRIRPTGRNRPARGENQWHRTPSSSQFVAQVEEGRVQAVTIKPDSNSVKVKTSLGESYTTAYPSNTEIYLLRQLLDQRVPFDVKAEGGGWAAPSFISRQPRCWPSSGCFSYGTPGGPART